MQDLLRRAPNCFVTDTVEGVVAPIFFKGEQQVTMTSTWCPVRQTQVAVLITILDYKDYKSYMIHWRHLFEIYGHNRHRLRDPVNPAASFHDRWPGNTSDFSEALFKGFFESMDELCKKRMGRHLRNQICMAFVLYISNAICTVPLTYLLRSMSDVRNTSYTRR
jgi:hypothetical protein